MVSLRAHDQRGHFEEWERELITTGVEEIPYGAEQMLTIPAHELGVLACINGDVASGNYDDEITTREDELLNFDKDR